MQHCKTLVLAESLRIVVTDIEPETLLKRHHLSDRAGERIVCVLILWRSPFTLSHVERQFRKLFAFICSELGKTIVYLISDGGHLLRKITPCFVCNAIKMLEACVIIMQAVFYIKDGD
jgi:hypothetical protein